jgi:hypothetical protein
LVDWLFLSSLLRLLFLWRHGIYITRVNLFQFLVRQSSCRKCSF